MKKLMTIGAAVVLAAVFTGCPDPSQSSNGAQTEQPVVASTVDNQVVKADSLYEKISDTVYRCTITDPRCVSSHNSAFYYILFDPQTETKYDIPYLYIPETTVKVRRISGGSSNTMAGIALLPSSPATVLYSSNNTCENNCILMLAKDFDAEKLNKTYNRSAYFYDDDAKTYHLSECQFLNSRTELSIQTKMSSETDAYLAGSDAIVNSIQWKGNYKYIQHCSLEGFKWGFVVIPDSSDVVSEENPLVIEFTLEEVSE